MDLGIVQNPVFIARWLHVLAGITWIGLLYYFNFVQGGYIKNATAEGKSDVLQKLAPEALWWFRWGAMLTFLTGLILLAITKSQGIGIITGATLGTLMFLNVWLIIWPAQKIVIAAAKGEEVSGDPAAAGARALLASRTNTLFSFPMAFFMLHIHSGSAKMLTSVMSASTVALVAVFGLIGLLELNAIKGKTGPMTSVKGVIHMGIALTVVLYLFIELL